MTVKVIPGEFTPFTIAIAILSGIILFYGYVSMFVKERMFLSEAFVALIVGIIAGPLVTNGFNPYSWENTDEITKELTRCVIAIQVMAVGIELPKHYLKKEWRTMFMFLIPIMIFMWLISGLFIWALIPPLDYLHALVIAACVCPTDPILANSVVKGRFAEKHVPAHIRNALSAESGANDGMGFPFLFLALFLINEDSVGTAIGKWVYITVLFQIVLSCVIGAVVGWVACKVLQWSEKKHLIDKPSFLSFGIALALFLMSMTGFSGSDDVLACFVAGNAFSWDEWFRIETEEAHFQDVIDMMLNLAVFVYIGTIIPWSEFGNAAIGLSPWRLVVIAILVLLFRRLPIVVALKPVMPAMKTYREAIFSGWFGPMGVGAVFLAMIAKEELEEVYAGKPQHVSIELITPVVLFIVLSSTLVHGTTIPLFKIGKRIRTRTLSITSTGSNQVLRLPKIGQQLSRKSAEDDRRSRHSYHEGMTELQRNTLINTLQQQERMAAAQQQLGDSGQITNGLPHESIIPSQSDHAAIDMKRLDHTQSTPVTATHHTDDEDDFAEEEFLPGEEEEDEPTTQSIEPQSIRFLEPINPRIATGSSSNNNNVDKNEHSVSSFRGWLHRNNKDSMDENNGSTSHTSLGGGGSDESPSGLRQLFTSRRQPSKDLGSRHPRIKVWDEDHHIVIEDIGDSKEEVVEKTGDHWKQKVQGVIDSMEKDIDNNKD
ncbi:Sodium/hydrogen exchanger family-domain-containing protein [Halteromyces radiatus]|uniref:Sodium/hydrogen exchanger family-domain-containing protein n=1 Tax=Halteromyces radiatus TaxID=101107 RepID=UPI0022210084|nr:Sodium/hydrogen exchanger family-domain-containing protein [Halteromyces radiatus]KAI8089555.1 Sodium/hydrogen exchanger family-domain-containing protein [Halteromyces radiatus]